MLADHVLSFPVGILGECPICLCQHVCALDMEIFGGIVPVAVSGGGVVVFASEAFTRQRLSSWAACAERGRQRGQRFRRRLRMGMSTREEFRAFCKAAESYFDGLLRRQVLVALEQCTSA